MTKEKKITIAFFLPSLEPGGAERNVVNLVNNIDRKKYILSLVLGKAEGDFIKEINRNIPIINLDVFRSLELFFKLIKYFKEEEPNIFVPAFTRINIICIMARIFSRAKTKIIVTEHAIFSFLPIIAKTAGRRFFARFFLPSIGKLVYPRADAIVCVSKGIAENFIKNIGCRKKIRIIYNPIVNNEIKKLAKESFLEPWLINLKTPLVIAVGRLVKCKDYPSLFKAFGRVLKKASVHLIILGKGPEENKLKKMVSDLSLSSHITFLGFQNNPYKYMKRASVFVLSSLQEGFGNVIIEAMAAGCPVVSTNCPTGPGEIIEHMKNGILVPVNDEKSLADAILKILDNPILAEKFSIEGKKRADFFSVKNSVGKYEEIFQTIINNRSNEKNNQYFKRF